MGAELFHANRREEWHTDMTTLIVAIRNFAKTPEMERKKAKILLILN